MTYAGFLGCFIGIPILLLAAAIGLDRRRGQSLPVELRGTPFWPLLGAHALLAVLYTTPWDNYLVASGVWQYEPGRVAGIILGYVPLEEYGFFVLQTALTGLWLGWLAPRMRQPAEAPVGRKTAFRVRTVGLSVAAVVWLMAIGCLLSGWQPGTYFGLEVGWLLLPLFLQIGVAGEELWRRRRLVAAAWLPPALYLSWADSIAIGKGIWTIEPAQTTGLRIGSLPVEESVFFLLTNALIVFGMVLFMGADDPRIQRWSAGEGAAVLQRSAAGLRHRRQELSDRAEADSDLTG